MIGFVETISSHATVRLDDIERIDDAVPNEHGVPLHRVRLRDGKSFTTFDTERGGLLLRPVQIIPAEPGTKIIRADHKGVFARTCVVAWAICLDGEMRPVTPNGVNDGTHGKDVYVELPNGEIEAVGQYSEPPGFKDAEAMDRHFRKDADAGSISNVLTFADGLERAAQVADEVLAQLRDRPEVLLGWTVTQGQIRQAERISTMIRALLPAEQEANNAAA